MVLILEPVKLTEGSRSVHVAPRTVVKLRARSQERALRMPIMRLVRIKRIMLISALVSVMPFASGATGIYEEAAHGEITEVVSGDRVLYRYVNEDGETVIVDRPPRGFDYRTAAITPGDRFEIDYTPAPRPRIDTGKALSWLGDALWYLAPLVLLVAGARQWMRWRAPARSACEKAPVK